MLINHSIKLFLILNICSLIFLSKCKQSFENLNLFYQNDIDFGNSEINLYRILEEDITVGRMRLKNPIFYDQFGFVAGRLQHIKLGVWLNKCFSEFSNETAAAYCESLNFSDQGAYFADISVLNSNLQERWNLSEFE